MKKIFVVLSVFAVFLFSSARAQEIQTLFKSSRPSGGYAGVSNKFTSIKGEYANIAEVYGGWFVHKRLLVGLSAAATTNNIHVPAKYSTSPSERLSWQYGQVGLVNEYVFGSNKVVHFNITMFNGGGFTVQYQRYKLEDWENDTNEKLEHDENFFYVLEPGAQLEVNLFKWLRLSPGISYRKTFGSEGLGLSDKDLSDWSYNVTLKVGKF